MKFFVSAIVMALINNTSAIEIKAMTELEADADTFAYAEAELEADLDANVDADAEADAGIAQTCTANTERMKSVYNTMHAFKHYNAMSSGYFADPTFPADKSSLYWGSFLTDAAQANLMNKKITHWGRPSQLGGSPSWWGSKGAPHSTGVVQGNLGDCWMLGGTAAVAEVPSRMKAIMPNQESYNPRGIFRFKFWLGGAWHWTNVDDRIPLKSNNVPYSTNKSKFGAWWMPIMEKAYAKTFMNYERLDSGAGTESLSALTGKPVLKYKLFYKSQRFHSGSQFWADIKPLAGRNYPMTGICSISHNGLIDGHLYTLLDLVELTSGGSVAHRLVKLRNPWGAEKYTGPFSDASSLWTADFKTQAGFHAGNDGVIFVPLNIFS